MIKIKLIDTILILSLLTVVFFSFQFDWWSNGNLKVQDYIFFPILLLPIIFIKKRMGIFFLLLLSGLIINLYSFGPIGSCFLLLFCSYNLGFYLVNNVFNYETGLFSFESLCVGLGIISLSIFIFSFFKVNYPIFYLIIYLLPSLLIFIKLKLKGDILKEITFNFSQLNLFALITITYLIIYYFCAILLPETSHDAVSHHLTIATQMSTKHFWGYDIMKYVWSVGPQGSQWLFTFLYFFDGVNAIKLFLAIIPFIISIYFFNFFIKKFNDFHYAVLVGLMILSLPINLYLVRGLFIDLTHTLIVSCLFLLILENKKNKWLIIASLVGFSFAIKSSTVIILPLIFFLYVLEKIKNKEFIFKELFYSFLLVIIFGLGPYIIAYIKTGSPTFPLYNEIFKSELISTKAFYHPLYAEYNFLDFFKTSLMSKNYGEYVNNGVIGIGFVVLFPVLFIFLKLKDFKDQKIYIFLGLILGCAIMFKFQAYLRYIYFIIPSIFFILLLIIYEKANNKKIFKIVLCLIVLINCLRFDKIINEIPDDLSLYFSKQKNLEFAIANKPLIKLAEIINTEARFQNKKILILSYNNDPIFYKFNLPVMFFSWHSFEFFNKIIGLGSLEKTIKDMQIDYIIYNSDHTVEKYENFFKDHPKSFTKKIFDLYGFIVAKTENK